MIPFQLVEVPGSAPYRCPCGNGLVTDGPYLWTGLPGAGGDLFLCSHCLGRAVAPLECVPKADFDVLAGRVSVADRRLLLQEEELRTVRAELVAAVDRCERDAGAVAELRAERVAVDAAFREQLAAARARSGPRRQVAANLAAAGAAARSTTPVQASKSTQTKEAA